MNGVYQLEMNGVYEIPQFASCSCQLLLLVFYPTLP